MSKKHKHTRHCTICKKCVLEHDHHCVWTNTCIGKNNYWSFIVFLVLFSVDVLFDVSVYLYDVLVYHRDLNGGIGGFGKQDIEFYLLTIGMLTNITILVIMAPISYKKLINLKNYVSRKKRERNRNESLANILLLKDIPPAINDSTSDTASMLVRESIESHSSIVSLMED